MKCHPFVLSIALLFIAVAAFGEKAAQRSEERDKTVKATYLVTGLHCPPCTKTVESSLQHVKGIRSIKVDWKSKDARIEFDEALLPAQKVAQLIADTPHMMGRNMHYGGLLLLKVADIKNEGTAKPTQEALSKVTGVKRVVAYPAQHSVGIEFDTKGKLTSQELVDALADAGIKATTL
jgi:copper chaperone CopZ